MSWKQWCMIMYNSLCNSTCMPLVIGFYCTSVGVGYLLHPQAVFIFLHKTAVISWVLCLNLSHPWWWLANAHDCWRNKTVVAFCKVCSVQFQVKHQLLFKRNTTPKKLPLRVSFGNWCVTVDYLVWYWEYVFWYGQWWLLF